jgi:hypothetical protein
MVEEDCPCDGGAESWWLGAQDWLAFYRSSSGTAGTRGPLLIKVIVGSIRKVSGAVLLLDTFLRAREARKQA